MHIVFKRDQIVSQRLSGNEEPLLLLWNIGIVDTLLLILRQTGLLDMVKLPIPSGETPQSFPQGSGGLEAKSRSNGLVSA